MTLVKLINVVVQSKYYGPMHCNLNAKIYCTCQDIRPVFLTLQHFHLRLIFIRTQKQHKLQMHLTNYQIPQNWYFFSQ